MMIKAILATSALVGALLLPVAVQAQDYRFEGGRGGYNDDRGFRDDRNYRRPPPPRRQLDARQIHRVLARQGYARIDIVNRRGDAYIVRAIGPRGRDVILVVDSWSGEILRRRAIQNDWRGDRGWHGGWGNDWRRW